MTEYFDLEWPPDRTGWAPGPWDDEPDRLHWVDPGTNLDCLAVRNRMGGWCGYVGLPSGHRFHGKTFSAVAVEMDVSVHGGLTYSAECQPDGPICHTPEPGQPDGLWWLGFDCGHAMDHQPGLAATLRRLDAQFHHDYADVIEAREVYKTLDYVIDETTGLAEQLA